MPARRTLVAALVALWVVANANWKAEAGESSQLDDQPAVNLASGGGGGGRSSPHFVQKSDRLEAIKRYILQRLNVSDSRRFNRSTRPPPPPPPATTTTDQRAPPGRDRDGRPRAAPPPAAPASTRSFGSLTEALSFYAKQSAAADRVEPPPVGARVSVKDRGVHRRRRRLHPADDESATAGSSAEPRKRGGTARRRAKRRHRKHIKLTMTADTGQYLSLIHI